MENTDIIKLIKKAERYGIRSIDQFKLFMIVMDGEPEGVTYSQLSGNDDSQSPENKTARSSIRKLAGGYRRGNEWQEGLDLVRVIDDAVPTDRWGRYYLKAVRLTARGKRLAAQVDKIRGAV